MSLLPCPFCGCSDIVDEDCSNMQTNGTRLACNDCGAMVEGYGGSTCTARATAKWNARAIPEWVSCAERMPEPHTWVLVSDGENVREDRWYPWQEINGRGLLPSDPRRDQAKEVPRWSTYTNVTHWMPLPSAPSAAPNPKAELAGEDRP
jgi:Lar family restriction alleviation protein